MLRVRIPRAALPLALALSVLVMTLAAVAAWTFRPLLFPPEIAPPGPGWIPAVTLVAGTGGQDAVDGDVFEAAFPDPFGLAIGPDGSVVVADGGTSNRIRRIAGGAVITVAGGRRGFSDGRGRDAAFDTPSAVAVAADGTIFVADTGNHAIRRVSPDGMVTTVAGNGTAGWRDGRGRDARFDGPMGLALAADGRLFVADSYNDRIRAVAPNGQVTTIAGAGIPGRADGPAAEARFDTPTGLAVADGALLVADTGNNVVRKVDANGDVTTIGSVDSTAGSVGLFRPVGLGVADDGCVYVTDRRGWLVEIGTDGAARTLAGSEAGFANGSGGAARFRDPTGVAVARDGSVFVADRGNRLVRRLDLPQRLGETPPAPPGIRTGFDLDRFAQHPLVWPLDPQSGPHEVAGTLGEARGNPGGEGRERFHGGVDIHADDGDLVLAVRDGTVLDPIATGGFGSLNEYVTVGPVTYVHLRVGRDRRDVALDPATVPILVDESSGRASRARVRRGWHVRAGEPVGSVNRFRHVHLSIGPSGEESNALDIGLPGFVDTIAPTIAPRGVELTDLAGQPLRERKGGRLIVPGPVRIVVEAWDRVNGNVARRRLGVYRLGYQLLEPDLTPAPGFASPRMTVSFHRLPADPGAPLVLYAPGSGIPFYGTRRTRFRYVVTTRIEGGRVVEAPFDPSDLPPGPYVLRAIASDASGNTATADVPIMLGAVPKFDAPTFDTPGKAGRKLTPHP